jgi:2-polyprenyl-6-methoxyphenol hydroxylase-like FAD-dependent oxidoreductase
MRIIPLPTVCICFIFGALLTTPERGQGLNRSITDAGKLVGFLISKLSQKAAIEKYEAEVKARAGEEVRISVMNTTMLRDWGRVMKSPVMTAGLKKGT